VQFAASADERGFYVDASEVERRGEQYFHHGRVIDRYGADTVRLYELFLGPLDQDISPSPTES
jgi:hypothetical protein